MIIKNQKGNALFLILIAVALFAALSYAITQSNRGGGAGISKERDQIIAAQLVQVVSTLRAATQRLVMSGVAPKDVHFHTNTDRSSPCTLTDGTCLFTPEGGGAIFPVYGRDVPADAFDPAIYNAAYSINFNEVNESATGTGLPSIVVPGVGKDDGPEGSVGFVGIRKSVCEAINRGLTGSSDVYVMQAGDIDTSHMPAYIIYDFKIAENGGVYPCVDISILASRPAGTMYTYGGLLIEN